MTRNGLKALLATTPTSADWPRHKHLPAQAGARRTFPVPASTIHAASQEALGE